jgi:hypothetical protein
MGNVTNRGKIAYLHIVVKICPAKHFVMNCTTDLQICELSVQHFFRQTVILWIHASILRLDGTNVWKVSLSY